MPATAKPRDEANDRGPITGPENFRMTFYLTPEQREAFLLKQARAGHRFITPFIVETLGLDRQPSDA